jgi:4-amino-4-deoxy-L-arabinose transferase-like glycosyltransferase
MSLPISTRARDRLIALALGLATVTWLLAVEGREGFGRDEGQYFRAGERYWGWFEELAVNLKQGKPARSFTQSDLDRYWSDNAPDHPVVMKTLYGLSWRAFHTCTCMGPARGLHPIPVRGRHTTLPLFKRDSTAFRFPAILFAGLLVGLVYLFARQFVPWPAAAAGAVLTLAQPHYFFHAPIACFDAPITTMAFVMGFAYWKSLRSARWGMACGVIFGIALGTKHNAWLMPFFLAAHYLWMRRGDLWPRPRRLPRVPLAFISMAILGPMIFVLHWPWLWHAPLQRTRIYLNRHLQHEHYNFEYLGQNWNNPPTDTAHKLLRVTFPFVSTGLTVPVTTLALALVGGVVLLRRRRGQPVIEGGQPERDREMEMEMAMAALLPSAPAAAAPSPAPSWLRPGADVDRAPGAFLAVQIFGPLCVLALPSVPIFGGVKHYLPAMPYLAVAAAFGLAALARAAAAAVPPRRRLLQRALPVGLAALVCLPAVTETERSLPDGLSHYNLIAGGFAGGASLGMNRQFWAYCVLPMLDWVNRSHVDNRQMYWHDVLGDAINMYKREGRLDLEVGDTGAAEAGIERSRMGLLVYEKHWAIYEGWLWDSYGTVKPALVRDREGVPLVIAYKRGVR